MIDDDEVSELECVEISFQVGELGVISLSTLVHVDWSNPVKVQSEISRKLDLLMRSVPVNTLRRFEDEFDADPETPPRKRTKKATREEQDKLRKNLDKDDDARTES